MFYNNYTLVGGNGFKYVDNNPNDKTHARVDTDDTPGYFTDGTKNAVLVADSLISQDENSSLLEEASPGIDNASEEAVAIQDSVVGDELIVEPIEAIDGNIVELFQTPFDAIFK